MQRRLGKLTPRHDKRTLRLANYLTSRLPIPPPSIDYAAAVSAWPMLANDRIGDCTIAAAAHMIQAWSAAAGDTATVTEDVVVSAYSAVSGYNPDTGEPDDGAVELDVLKYWAQWGLGGHRIGAYAKVNLRSMRDVRAAAWIFGGLYIGLNLPATAEDQEGDWTVQAQGTVGDGAPGSWGGHAVNVVGYDTTGLTCITWGGVKRLTWDFFVAYADEAWAIISPDFMVGDKCPAGFDLPTLQRDLRVLRGA